jgi:flagellin
MAINDISLTSGMRTNLVSLQTTTDLLNRTQDRLSSGKKVNTALDNALNYFTAKSLNTRADELAGYKDGMSEAVQTIKAANAGITAIEGLIAQAKAIAATAKAGASGAVTSITVDLASVTAGQTIAVGTTTFTAVASDNQKSIDFAGILLNDTVTIGGTAYTAVGVQKTIDFAAITGGNNVTIGGITYTATTATTSVTTMFQIVTTTTASDIAANMASFLTKAGITTAGTTAAGLITLSAATSVSTVTATGVTTALRDLAANEFLIAASGATATATGADAAANFITKIGGTNSSSGSLVTLSVATSTTATTDSINGSDLTNSIGTTQFYIGDAGTGQNAAAATNLAAKITLGAQATAAVSGAQITLTGGTINPLLTTTVAESLETFTTVYSQTATADRSSYATQYNSIMEQLDLVATDSSYKGINFLEANSTLDVVFGTVASDKITLTGFDASATSLLGKATDSLYAATAERGWQTNADVDVDIAALASATATLKAESARMSTGLSIINTRQDWVKYMVNTVTEGADNLTLADMNEEGANMLMLQTRQSLSTTALSLSAQAAQSVLKLFA